MREKHTLKAAKTPPSKQQKETHSQSIERKAQNKIQKKKKNRALTLNTSTPLRVQPSKLLQLFRPRHPLKRNPARGGPFPRPLHQELQIAPRPHPAPYLTGKIPRHRVLLPLDACSAPD